MDVAKLYSYDETSPSCLRWAVDVYSGRWKNIKNVSVGDVAGGLGNSGYYQVRRNGVLQLVHRVVWELHYGEIPCKMFVDHIDGNKVNNKISNLRLVEREGNARNCSQRKDNVSGVVGVSLCTNTLRSGNVAKYWRVQWKDTEGRSCSKAFNIGKLGDEVAYQSAVDFRIQIIKQLNEKGAGYTERHYLSHDSAP